MTTDLSRIAKTILANQNSASGAVNRQAIADELGFDGMGEALRRGWIETREDGCVGVPSGATRAAELRAAAATESFSEADRGAPPAGFALYRRFTESDASRRVVAYDQGEQDKDRYTVVYLGVPVAFGKEGRLYRCLGMSGHGDGMPGPHLGRQIPYAEVPEALRRTVERDLGGSVEDTYQSGVTEDADPDVGDEVVVADQGKTYQASVSGRNVDGSFRLSFSGADKPARDSYRKEEMRVTRTVAKASQPPVAQAPSPANPTVAKTTTSPVAPGLATRA